MDNKAASKQNHPRGGTNSDKRVGRHTSHQSNHNGSLHRIKLMSRYLQREVNGVTCWP